MINGSNAKRKKSDFFWQIKSLDYNISILFIFKFLKNDSKRLWTKKRWNPWSRLGDGSGSGRIKRTYI